MLMKQMAHHACDAPKSDTLAFARDGAERIHAALNETSLQDIERALQGLRPNEAGIRLYGIAGLRPYLLPSGSVGKIAASVLGNECQPVRAVLFDKTPETNWSLTWHQDRTIAVAKRVEVDGFGPWTIKHGMLHVAPPFELLAKMVTLRLHLDAVPANNAPLLIAPGSHQFGRIPEAEARQVVHRCGTVICLANAGDIWIYATPILHASEAAREPGHRRVLQVDFAVDALPGGLEWLGV